MRLEDQTRKILLEPSVLKTFRKSVDISHSQVLDNGFVAVMNKSGQISIPKTYVVDHETRLRREREFVASFPVSDDGKDVDDSAYVDTTLKLASEELGWYLNGEWYDTFKKDEIY